jgi:hypothetical protein
MNNAGSSDEATGVWDDGAKSENAVIAGNGLTLSRIGIVGDLIER